MVKKVTVSAGLDEEESVSAQETFQSGSEQNRSLHKKAEGKEKCKSPKRDQMGNPSPLKVGVPKALFSKMGATMCIELVFRCVPTW